MGAVVSKIARSFGFESSRTAFPLPAPTACSSSPLDTPDRRKDGADFAAFAFAGS
uniref:Uncharacterized protein n=1 Tax=Picea sitchensis TaxID=3332 RepID=A0A6B9XRK3_PICSI|nr:hypothetical protein Q903MT_gene5820 [Picea sitchensis]